MRLVVIDVQQAQDLVGLVPSNHGTTVQNGFGSGSWCASCDQQAAGSDFLTALNTPDETPGSVDYTQVTTRYDQVVVPYTSAFLTEDGPGSLADLLTGARAPAAADRPGVHHSCGAGVHGAGPRESRGTQDQA